MLQDFDELVKKRNALMNWWKLGSTIAEYDNKRHSLRVDVMKPSMVAFFGQAYAGAENYHDAPSWFADVVRQEISKHISKLTADAYKEEITRLNEQIQQHRDAVLAQLNSAT